MKGLFTTLFAVVLAALAVTVHAAPISTGADVQSPLASEDKDKDKDKEKDKDKKAD